MFAGLQETGFEFNPKQGTYTKVGEHNVPHFMGNYPYTLFTARAPAPGPAVTRIAAIQAAVKQQVRPCTSGRCMYADARWFPNGSSN